MRHQRLLRFLFFLPLRLGVVLYAILTARSEDLNRNSPLHIFVSILLFLAPLVEDRTLMVPWLMVYGAEFVYLFPWDCCGDLCSTWNYIREFILGYGLLVVSSYYLLLKDIEEVGPIDLGTHWVPGIGWMQDEAVSTRGSALSVSVVQEDGVEAANEQHSRRESAMSVDEAISVRSQSMTRSVREDEEQAGHSTSSAAICEEVPPPPEVIPFPCPEEYSPRSRSQTIRCPTRPPTAYQYGAQSTSSNRSTKRVTCIDQPTVMPQSVVSAQGMSVRRESCPPCPPCPPSQRQSSVMQSSSTGKRGKFSDACQSILRRSSSGADPSRRRNMSVYRCSAGSEGSRNFHQRYRRNDDGSKLAFTLWSKTWYFVGKGVRLLLGTVAYILDNAFDTEEYQQALYTPSSLSSSASNRRVEFAS